jgi:hypothetical protein
LRGAGQSHPRYSFPTFFSGGRKKKEQTRKNRIKILGTSPFPPFFFFLFARVKIAPSCHTLEVQGASARCAVLSLVPVLLTVAGSEQELPTALDAANF